MLSNQITCPNCSHQFSMSDEFQKNLEMKLKEQQQQEEQKWEKERGKLEEENKKIRDEKKTIAKEVEEKQKNEYEKKLHEEKITLWKTAQEKADEKLNSEYSLKMKDLEEQNKENRTKLEESQQKELNFLKKERELEEKQKSFELELQKKMHEERKEIEETAKKQSDEEHRLKLMEKEKQMEQMKKSLEDAQRRAEQGSMQIQGDVQEEDLRDMLRAQFMSDDIADVPTGIRGADLIHTVKNQLGSKCGVILWESKNTKVWTQGWIQKLKDDQAALGSDIAILVTKTLPEGVDDYEYRNGVWVVNYASVLILVSLLRFHMIEVGKVKNALQGQDEKMQVLFEYLSSPQFKNRIENIIGAFDNMKTDLDKEKRAMNTIWNRREKELERVMLNTSGFYGDLQGITGSNLAGVEQFELLEEGERDEEKIIQNSIPF